MVVLILLLFTLLFLPKPIVLYVCSNHFFFPWHDRLTDVFSLIFVQYMREYRRVVKGYHLSYFVRSPLQRSTLDAGNAVIVRVTVAFRPTDATITSNMESLSFFVRKIAVAPNMGYRARSSEIAQNMVQYMRRSSSLPVFRNCAAHW